MGRQPPLKNDVESGHKNSVSISNDKNLSGEKIKEAKE